jgi:hypothetical protein
MARGVISGLLAGGVAVVIVYFGTRSPDRQRRAAPRAGEPASRGLRNASLSYRSIGASGERYPAWVRALRGKSGVYLIRERQRDGSNPLVYIGESHTQRLYHTLTRHFQTWRRAKKFWVGQYTGSQHHDPGLTYDRARCTVAVRVLSADRAIREEARLISRLRPRDNLAGVPEDEHAQAVADDEDAPF